MLLSCRTHLKVIWLIKITPFNRNQTLGFYEALNEIADTWIQMATMTYNNLLCPVNCLLLFRCKLCDRLMCISPSERHPLFCFLLHFVSFELTCYNQTLIETWPLLNSAVKQRRWMSANPSENVWRCGEQ